MTSPNAWCHELMMTSLNGWHQELMITSPNGLRQEQMMTSPNHRCKKRFLRFLLFFYKNAFFNVFYFWERFLFSSGKFFYRTKPAKILLNLPNSCIKRLLSDGFNMT